MKNHRRILSLLPGVLIFILLMGGCAKPPTGEMDAAELAVAQAENNADAVTYGASSLARARDALTRMREEAAAKRYDAAKTLAAEAVASAERALNDGRAGAVRARQDAADLVGSLQAPLTETGNAINAAKQVENLQIDFGLIDQEYESARWNADQAQLSLSNNNFKDATEKSQAVRLFLNGSNTQLADAVQIVTRKK